MFLIIAISHKRFLQSTPQGAVIWLFGTWSQAHAYDPSDYMETRLKAESIKYLNNKRVVFNNLIITGLLIPRTHGCKYCQTRGFTVKQN